MRIAVVNETSAADRNADIIAALDGRGHTLLNCGMSKGGQAPELSYIHTGLMAGLLLGSGAADLVVGGCGTGQGFLISASQYPGVFCGHLLSPLDALLFARINAGNCVSLALNQGYGWAGDLNLRLLFDQLFAAAWGSGYPAHRAEPQKASRASLAEVSKHAHASWASILAALPDSIALPALTYPGFAEVLSGGAADPGLAEAAKKRARR